jgi:hypothetical protein
MPHSQEQAGSIRGTAQDTADTAQERKHLAKPKGQPPGPPFRYTTRAPTGIIARDDARRDTPENPYKRRSPQLRGGCKVERPVWGIGLPLRKIHFRSVLARGSSTLAFEWDIADIVPGSASLAHGLALDPVPVTLHTSKP